MFEYLWLPCMATVAAIALSTILFKKFLKKKRAGQIAVEGRADSDSATENGTVESAARTCTSSPVNETATSSVQDCEVFLSFRGPDTRAGFTDFLYTSLTDAGIRAFKDDEDLRVGEEFAPELLEAINQSKISIPIFSKGYASSVWCLKELVQMVECQKTRGQKIMPIFYDVAPSEVRHQTGGYGRAFRSHEKKRRYDKETMRKWKAALEEVSSLNGWNLHNEGENRREGDFARNLTQKVFNELKKAHLAESDNLVNVDNHVDVIMEMIGAGTDETRIIVIHGMGGIGKTTTAKMIYNRLADEFENHCFLRDIRETSKSKGIQCVQNQLISGILKGNRVDIKDIDEGTQTIKERLSNKRVLLLLDDVEEQYHIDALVCKRAWLGKGSKIIITTRKKNILNVSEVDGSYELSGMDPHQSLRLFSKHAFRRDSPLEEYIDLSKRAIGIANGLPLALEVMGSLLSLTKKENWDITLEKLENIPDEKVQSKLKISYDVLDGRQQHIFLDIACLFIGYDKDTVVYFLDESKFFSKEAMEVLENMSLIKIKEDNKMWMHDQLRDFGREMVRQKSKRKIKKQSRVWDPEEALKLLKSHEGKTKVEALRLRGQHRFTDEDFTRLPKLRFFEVDGFGRYVTAEERLLRNELESNYLPTNVFQENSNLLPRLRWLSWRNIPRTCNIRNLSMENMVILDLSHSDITDDWEGWNHMKVMKNLKILDLSYCGCLKRTPNFSAQSNLERLILRSCDSLIELDKSICQLKCLVVLDLAYCKNLRRLPDELGGDLASLEYLSLQSCKSLERLPDTIGSLESLIELSICWTRIKELPDSIGKLKNLKVVSIEYNEVSKIPEALWMIEKLEKIEASGGSGGLLDGNIDGGIYRNESLRSLKLGGMRIHGLPRLPESLIKLHMSEVRMDTFLDLSNLANLKELDLSVFPNYNRDLVGLWNLRKLENLSKLESLALRCDFSSGSPTDLCLPPQLKSLKIDRCNLSHLPTLPSSLSSLRLVLCKSLRSVGDLSNLKKLSNLEIGGAAITEIQGLGCLENLRDLKLENLKQVKTLPNLSNLSKLRSLYVSSCGNLVELQDELSQSLERLEIHCCDSLLKIPDLSSLKDLQAVRIAQCGNLVEIQGELPQSLEELMIRDCESFWKLPNLLNLKKLSDLSIEGAAITEIQGLGWLENLRDLKLERLEQVKTLPDLSNLSKLRSLYVGSCGNLVELQGKLPQSLERLAIHFCNSLLKFPDLSSLKELQAVDIWECGNLVEIQGELPQSLEELTINYCGSLRKLPNLSNLKKLSSLKIEAAAITEIQGRGWLENLQYLQLCFLGQREILPDLSSLSKLTILTVSFCRNLVELQGELPQSLENLSIYFCNSLLKFPDLSSLKELQALDIWGCGNLVEIQGELPQSLEKLQIHDCGSLRELPNLSSIKGLRLVEIKRCGKLNVKAISSLCSEKSVKFVGDDNGWDRGRRI